MALPQHQSDKVVEYPIFADLIYDLSRLDLKAVATEAGVSYSTLWHWCYGATMAPRIDTIHKVANALGYGITLVRNRNSKKKAKLRVIK